MMRKTRSDKGVRRKRGVEDAVITVKLNRLDPYEGEALRIWEHYRSSQDEFGEPYSSRLIVAAALHALAGNDLPSSPEYARLGIDQAVTQFNMHLLKLEQVIDRLNQLGIETANKPRLSGKKSGGTIINRDYLSNLKKAVRGSEDE